MHYKNGVFILLFWISVLNLAQHSQTNSRIENQLNSGYRKLTRLYSRITTPIAILGAPFSKGQGLSGTELAPKLFREQNLIGQIERLGYDSVEDYGDLKFKTNGRDSIQIFSNNYTQLHNVYTVSAANKLIENKVAEILQTGQTLVVLGGDHSITAGSILGNARVNPNLCVLYVDGHGDINNCESTTSGNMHGMPLSFVIQGMQRKHKYFKACPPMNVFRPLIPASAIGLFALRDLDDLELDIINEFKIKHYSMKDIDEIGIIEAVNQTLNTICKTKTRIHVSFDIDSLDQIYTPNTGTSVLGGLTVREALQMAELIAKTKKLNVIELYEVNPLVEPKRFANKTTNIAMNIILAFLGKSREVYWAQPWEGGWGQRD